MNYDFLTLLMSQNYIVYFWLISAIVFLLFELLTPGLFFFIAFAIGCAATAPFVFVYQSFAVQCLIALFLSLIAFWILRKLFASKMNKEKVDETNIYAICGKKGLVLVDISEMSSGQVKVGGEIWMAKSKENVKIEKNAAVKVVEVVGNHLIVTRLND